MSDMIFECFQSAKINLKKAIASLGLKLWRVWFSQKVEKYIPNEFSFFWENHTSQNL